MCIADQITTSGTVLIHQAPTSSSVSCAAAGGDQAAGLVQAIAVVTCNGGASAEAFAEALKRTIVKDPVTGCDVLTTAKATAYARCGPTGAFASASSAISKVSTRSTVHYRLYSTVSRDRVPTSALAREPRAHEGAHWDY